jgi:hypothetical protein
MDASDQINGLWRYYEEQAAQVRQHEDLRATVSSTLAGIAAAVVALAAIGGLSLADIPSGIVVALLGALGFALSLKHYERNRLHAAIMGTTRAEIDRLLFTGPARTTSELRIQAEQAHNKKHRVVSRVRLNVLWLGLPLGISLIGLLLIVLSIVGVPAIP